MQIYWKKKWTLTDVHRSKWLSHVCKCIIETIFPENGGGCIILSNIARSFLVSLINRIWLVRRILKSDIWTPFFLPCDWAFCRDNYLDATAFVATSRISLLFSFSFYLAFNRPPSLATFEGVALDIAYFQRSAHVTTYGIFLRLNGRVSDVYFQDWNEECVNRDRVNLHDPATRGGDLNFAPSSLPFAWESPRALASQTRSDLTSNNELKLTNKTWRSVLRAIARQVRPCGSRTAK